MTAVGRSCRRAIGLLLAWALIAHALVVPALTARSPTSPPPCWSERQRLSSSLPRSRPRRQSIGVDHLYHGARGHRAIRHPRGRGLEARGEGVDDGVLLLIAKDDRALRIEVGRGLEGPIPDAIANRVIDEVIVPAKAGISAGIEAGVDRLIRLVDGEPSPLLRKLRFGRRKPRRQLARYSGFRGVSGPRARPDRRAARRRRSSPGVWVEPSVISSCNR
ncbi:MAG: TPM domain-containing protein [Gammaproteobacteria bacterium]